MSQPFAILFRHFLARSLVCVLVSAVCGPTLAEGEAVPAAETDWKWECELLDKTFAYDGIIPVRTTLTNRSGHSVNLRSFSVHAHYGITVKDWDGRAVSPTKEGAALLHPEFIYGSWNVLLKPGEAYRIWIDLRKYFILSVPASYTVQISYHIVGEDPKGKRKDVVIDKLSPVMKFEIAPKAP